MACMCGDSQCPSCGLAQGTLERKEMQMPETLREKWSNQMPKFWEFERALDTIDPTQYDLSAARAELAQARQLAAKLDYYENGLRLYGPVTSRIMQLGHVVIEPKTETVKEMFDERDRLMVLARQQGAENESLRGHLRTILGYMDRGEIVRSIKDDDKPDFYIRMAKFVADLQAATKAAGEKK